MADEGVVDDSPEAVVKELGIKDYNPENSEHKTFIGIITKLRGQKRGVENQLTKLTTEKQGLEQELTGYRRTTKESELISSVLGDTHEITDQEKFKRYAPKNFGESGWEDAFKQTVKDFASEKKKDTPPPPPEDKKEEPPAKEQEKPKEEAPKKEEPKSEAYMPRRLRGADKGTEEIKGTQAVSKNPGFSEKLKLAKENPDAYRELRAKQGRK